MKVGELDKPAVPVMYALLILDVARDHGADPTEVLARAGIPAALVDDPAGRLSANQAATLLLSAVRVSGEPGFGYEIGLRSTASSHGIMGYGLLSSATIREAIELGVEYLRLLLPMMAMELREEDGPTGDGIASIVVTETVPLRDTRRVVFDFFLVGLARLGPVLSENQAGIEDVEMWFDDDEPPYFPAYRDRLPTARFGMGSNQIRFPAAHLDLGPGTANAVTARMVEEQCRRELEALGFAGDFVEQVRALLMSGAAGFNLEAAARSLHLSARTLRRRLHEHGTSFHDLVGVIRRAESTRLLRTTSLSLDQLADRLGYSDASNFARAFQKWTGMTPGTFRSRDTHPTDDQRTEGTAVPRA
jgi:AraC-like DNA-binding protein